MGHGESGESAIDADHPGGEIYAIYVDPGHWGHGVGRRLLTDAVSYLTGVGLTPVRLWVLTGNVRARRIYEEYGFRSDNLTKPFFRERDGRTVESTETRYTLVAPT